MNSPNFQLNKVRRLINTGGTWFTFSKQGKNEFNEPNGVETSTVRLKGIYHETTSYLKKASDDAATVRAKPSPMILCLYEASSFLDLEFTLTYRGKLYRIGEIKDIAESGVACDISLEEVQQS